MNDADSVYERNAARVYRVCYLKLGRREDAEDAVQNIFVRYLRSNIEFESEEHEKAYFLRAAHNECVNIKRALSRIGRIDFEDIPETLVSCSDDTKPVEVAEILRGLPSKYREVVYMFYYEDMTTAAIAPLLGRNESTVRTQLQKARALMRKIITEDYHG